jgi:hypothetical protein
MPGVVGRSNAIFVPKVAQRKSSLLSRFGVGFVKATASVVGALGGCVTSNTSTVLSGVPASGVPSTFVLGLPSALGTSITMPLANNNSNAFVLGLFRAGDTLTFVLGLPAGGGTSSTMPLANNNSTDFVSGVPAAVGFSSFVLGVHVGGCTLSTMAPANNNTLVSGFLTAAGRGRTTPSFASRTISPKTITIASGVSAAAGRGRTL